MLLSTFFWLVKTLLTPTIEKIIFSSAIVNYAIVSFLVIIYKYMTKKWECEIYVL